MCDPSSGREGCLSLPPGASRTLSRLLFAFAFSADILWVDIFGPGEGWRC